MSDTVDALILDLLEWVGPTPAPTPEVMEAWRTSCPRLPVWEDANDRGFIERRREPGRGELISVSAAGAEFLRHHRASLGTLTSRVPGAALARRVPRVLDCDRSRTEGRAPWRTCRARWP